MMKMAFRIFSLFALLFFSAVSARAGLLPGIGRDSGTGPDGIMIFPSQLAMFCDISSSDIEKSDSVENCLDKLLLMSTGSQGGKQNYKDIWLKAYRQMNSVYLTDALNKKASSGDAEDEIDSETGGALNVTGAIASPEQNIRKKQEENAVLYGMTAQKTVDIIDTYSSLLALDAMRYYYTYEFSSGAAPIKGEKEDK